MPKTKTPGKLYMKCIFSFCDGVALVTPGKGNRIRGAKFLDYTCVCDCRARWSFTEEHFKRLDKDGKLSLK